MTEEFNILVYKNGEKEFKLKPNTSYQIIPKWDADAPDGLQKLRSTKIPDPSVAVNGTPLAYFDLDRQTYDTALTEHSKALIRLYPDKEERQKALREITKYILNPLASLKGSNTIDSNNFAFWDDFKVDLTVDDVYNTSNPLHLFYLYALIIHGKLAPTGLESESYFKTNSQFAVENKESVMNVSQKRELEKAKAIARFTTLMEDDKTKESLMAILDWMNFGTLDGSDEALLTTVFVNWLDKDVNQNPKEFLKVYDNYYKSDSGRNILGVFKELKDLHKAKKVLKTADGVLFGDELIGKDFKEAAEKITRSNDLTDKLYALTK